MRVQLKRIAKAPSWVKDDAPSIEQYASRIKRAIRCGTGNRIHNLRVDLTGTHVVLEGFCSSFHCFQLAQDAAMKTSEELPVDNRIDVL